MRDGKRTGKSGSYDGRPGEGKLIQERLSRRLWVRQLLALVGKEFQQIVRDPSSYLVAGVLPLLFLLLLQLLEPVPMSTVLLQHPLLLLIELYSFLTINPGAVKYSVLLLLLPKSSPE